MMTDTFSLKFQIYDCFPLVFCFLLYFQDLCLHVLMLSYNVKEGHFCSNLFHTHINDTASSPHTEQKILTVLF